MKLYTESKQPIILLNETLVHNSMAIGKIVKSNMHDINVYSTENQFEKGKLISCYYKNEKNMYVREQFGNKNTFSVDPENRIVYDSRKHQVAVYYYDVFIPDNCSPEVANAIRHMAKIDNAKNALMAYVAYDYKCYVEERKKYIYLMNSIIVAAIIPIFYLIMNLTLNQKEVKYYLDMGDTGMKVCTIISLLISFLLCAYTSFLSKPNIKKSFIALFSLLSYGYMAATLITIVCLFNNQIEFTGAVFVDFFLCFLAPILGLFEFMYILVIGIILMFVISLVKHIGISMILR